MIRRRVLLAVFLAIFGGIGFFAWQRSGAAPGGPAADGPDEPGADAAAASAADTGGSPDLSAPDAGSDAAGRMASLDRPLRVVSPDIELLAPGIVANDGLEASDKGAFADRNLRVALSVADGIEPVRGALARGGAEDDGADVAIVSLPSFVASYEQLRALKPEVFFVTAWSRGREALSMADGDALLDPPDHSIRLRGVPGEPSTFLSLFAMDFAGIDLKEVERSEDPDGEVEFAAVGRSHPELTELPEGHRIRLSTADAPGLIPFVAIAPHGFVENHPRALRRWVSGWLAGRDELGEDVPKAGRLIASKAEDADALDLIDLLGWIEFASPLQNARVSGLSGRVAATLDRLFRLTWRIWREAGVLTTPAPEAFPTTTEIIMHAVREHRETDGDAEAPSTFEPGEPEGDAIAIYRTRRDDIDEKEFVDRVGLLADIFRRSKLRVTVDWNRPLTEDLIERARKQFDLGEHRIYGGRSVPGPGTASTEIFAAE